MVQIYNNMGLQKKVAQEIVDILSTNKQGFLSVMMIEELQLIPDQENPLGNSLVTFFAFSVFGLMPLIPFIVASLNNLKVDYYIAGSSGAISLFFLFILGFSKSFVTAAKWYYSALETIFIGAISAGIAFGIGFAFSSQNKIL